MVNPLIDVRTALMWKLDRSSIVRTRRLALARRFFFACSDPYARCTGTRPASPPAFFGLTYSVFKERIGSLPSTVPIAKVLRVFGIRVLRAAGYSERRRHDHDAQIGQRTGADAEAHEHRAECRRAGFFAVAV